MTMTWYACCMVLRTRSTPSIPCATTVAELEAYAQMVLANPDFVERLKTNAPMNSPDHATYYGGDSKGYTDYPALSPA